MFSLRPAFASIASIGRLSQKPHIINHATCTLASLGTVSSPCQTPLKLQPLKMPFHIPQSAYIHIPFCRRRCFYCDFPIVVTGDASLRSPGVAVPEEERYIDALLREISINANLFSHLAENKNADIKDKRVKLLPLKTIYFGGGTPSLLSAEGVERILNLLKGTIGITKDCEITMEMDPGTFEKEKLDKFISLGINRISVGIQGFHDKTLKQIGRTHNIKQIYQAINDFHSCGLINWSMDLIASLPNVSKHEWVETIEKAIQMNPAHISIYDLQVEEDTKFGRMKKRGILKDKDEDERREALLIVWERLKKAGWEHYEVSNFARPGFKSRHNQVYWRNESFFGFGLGATSFVEGYRFARPKRLKEYYSYVNRLSQDTVKEPLDIFPCPRSDSQGYFEDYVINNLRLLHEGLDLDELGNIFGEEAKVYVLEAVRTLGFENAGMTEFIDNSHRLRLCDPHGVLLENTVASGILESTVWR